VDHAPDLVDVFTSGRDLLSRLSKAAPEHGALLQSLRTLTDGARPTPGELEQKALFEQYMDVLCNLSSKRPILILLDDLQWADSASLNLLFRLGRELAGGRILLLGAYRPEEVALGRGGERHPLEEVLAEFKRLYGDIWIDLSAENTDEGRVFVDELLNKEPNRFSQDFRDALFAHTEGHPLFTIELLREMQGRGDLVRDEAGNWIVGERLNWNRLPARVEGVIEARIGRLESELRDILTIASVEGEDFTAQVVARVKEADERGLVRRLSGELDKVHRLIGERGTLQIAEEQLYLYRFRHSLFQQHIYNGLGEFERKLLHKQVGQVLETLYGDRVGTILPQLALHFSQAGIADKAAHYALLAGDHARLIYAHQEAIDFYQRAIGYLKEQGDYERAARTLMKLGLTYHAIFDFQHARGAYDEAFAMRRREVKERKATVEAAPHPFRLFAGKPPTLDPTMSGDETSNFYIESLFSGLVELGAGYEILPDIAKSWQISADGCKYTFHLREDVAWSDDTQVTADDFVYALKRTLTPATNAPIGAASLFYDILNARAYHMGEISDPGLLGVRSLDELTLEVELERPASYFLHLMTILRAVPLHVVELHGETWTELDNLVTNGPFLLDSYLPGEVITLTRNPAYHGRFTGNLQDVELLLDIPFGSGEALEMYEKDSIDILFLDPGTYSARHSHIEEYISEPTPGTYCVGFDTSSPPFDDVSVRRAFAMALDRQKLADEVYMGERYPAMGGFVPPGMPGHSPGIALPYDPDQARHLLAQAGYPGGQGFPSLEIARPDLATIDYLKDQLAHNLNIEVTIRKMSWTDVLDKKQTWNFFIVSWNQDYPDPDNFLRVAIRSSIPYWRNETYDNLLEKAQRSQTMGKCGGGEYNQLIYKRRDHQAALREGKVEGNKVSGNQVLY
jgi:ABC-type oligopeptide transport system substrate-binding subunit